MLLTTLALVLVTVLSIHLHMRRTTSGPGAAASRPSGSPCPRCRAHAPAGAAICPACRVPLGAFEVVTAEVSTDAAGGEEGGGRLHAIVRADVCVGCGTCVDACPEAGAIRLEGKRAIIDPGVCVGHGRCVEACPVGGILMTTGDAVQRVEVPGVDVNFQTSIEGLYIVGELGGRGLIKNAVNEGKIAVEHVARLTRAGNGRPEPVPGTLDVVIVGSGPAGLSAGLEAQRLGLSYVVLERGTLADSIRKYPRHKLLLAEPVKMPLYGDLWIADASKESLLSVWEAIVARTGLAVQTGQEVKTIDRTSGLFRVATTDRTFHARHVVLALGRRGTPRRLGVPGEELAKVVYDIVEMEVFAGRRVLVVGGGDSAVESAVGLSRQDGTQVSLSYRSDGFKRVKSRNRAKLDEAVAAGRVKLLLSSEVREIRPDAVLLEMQGRSMTLPNDDVIIRIGGEPPFDFLKRLGVEIVRKNIRIAATQSEAGAHAS